MEPLALYCPRGQAKVWTATYTPTTDITGMHFAFTVRDPAGRMLFQLTNGSGITLTNLAGGVMTIAPTAAQTLWPVQTANWDLWRTDAGFEDQIRVGPFYFTPSYRL